MNEEEVLRVLREGADNWDYIDEAAINEDRSGDGITKGSGQREGGIRFYLPHTEEGRCRLEEIRRSMERLKRGGDGRGTEPDSLGEDPGSWRMVTAVLEDEDWNKVWKEYFRGFGVGERLFVKPVWEPPDSAAVEGRAVLELEVGGSFGTGDHASTRLCLEWLERYVQPHTTLLDIGCGSGILFIAALLLGAESARAVDRDPYAVAEAVRNAELNGLQTDRCHVCCGDVLGPYLDFLGSQKADLIVANVTADVVMSLGNLLDTLMKPGGVVLASGILDSRWHEVETFFREKGFCLLHKAQRQGWVAAAARRTGQEAVAE